MPPPPSCRCSPGRMCCSRHGAARALTSLSGQPWFRQVRQHWSLSSAAPCLPHGGRCGTPLWCTVLQFINHLCAALCWQRASPTQRALIARCLEPSNDATGSASSWLGQAMHHTTRPEQQSTPSVAVIPVHAFSSLSLPIAGPVSMALRPSTGSVGCGLASTGAGLHHRCAA